MDFKTQTIDTLKEMGFDEKVINLAYQKCEIKTVEGVVNYIDANPNLEIEAAQVPAENSKAMDIEQPAQEKVNPEGGESKPMDQEGIPVTDHINKEWRDQIMTMGYNKDPVEKALFMTQNTSVEKAVEWLEANKDQPDFEEALFIVTENPNKPKLTPEEAKAKAKELQNKIRAERLKKDKELQLQQEIDRLKSGKELTQAKREMEELQLKLAMEQLKKEKEETERAKQKILDEINKDRINKGLKPKEAPKKSTQEFFADVFKKMSRVYLGDSETVKT